MDDILRPLIGFRKQQNARLVCVHKGAQTFKENVCFGQVLAAGAFALEQVGWGIHADAVRALVNPELDSFQYGILHFRVVIIQVRLVMEKTVPEILLANRVVSPVGLFAIHKDDTRVLIFLVSIAPDVIITVFFVLRVIGVARGLEPGVLVGSMVWHQLDQNLERALMRLCNQLLEILHVAVHRVDAAVIADVVTVIAQRRWGNRQQPDSIHAKVAQVVQLFRDAFQVSPTVAIAVPESAHIQFVKDIILVPELRICHFLFP